MCACVHQRAQCPSLYADAELLSELGHRAGGLCSSLRREVHLGPQQGQGPTGGKPLRYGPNSGPRIRRGRLEWGGEILQLDNFHMCAWPDVWPLHPGTRLLGWRDGAVEKGAVPEPQLLPKYLQRDGEPGRNHNDTEDLGMVPAFWRRPFLNKLCSPVWLLSRAGCQLVLARDRRTECFFFIAWVGARRSRDGGGKYEDEWMKGSRTKAEMVMLYLYRLYGRKAVALGYVGCTPRLGRWPRQGQGAAS